MEPSNTETEVKFYVNSLPALEALLGRMGAAQVQPRSLEVNYRFDTASDELKRTRRVLRLRRCGETILTFKGPGQARDGLVSRQEIEVQVADLSQMRRLLEALGYRVTFVYEKYRSVYSLEGQQIMLDELPFGSFVEVEGDAEGIRRVAHRLGLAWERAVSASYALLFDDARSEFGLPFHDLTFANFADHPVRLKVEPAD